MINHAVSHSMDHESNLASSVSVKNGFSRPLWSKTCCSVRVTGQLRGVVTLVRIRSHGIIVIVGAALVYGIYLNR